MEQMFEKAAKSKLRFPTPVGYITTEQLWDLPLTSNIGRPNLNDLAKDLNRQIKESSEESFVETKSKVAAELQLAFDLVLYVIGLKKAENEANALAATKKQQRQRIMEIIAEKRDDTLKGKSLEELEALLAAQ